MGDADQDRHERFAGLVQPDQHGAEAEAAGVAGDRTGQDPVAGGRGRHGHRSEVSLP
jgi:hypothetical protein